MPNGDALSESIWSDTAASDFAEQKNEVACTQPFLHQSAWRVQNDDFQSLHPPLRSRHTALNNGELMEQRSAALHFPNQLRTISSQDHNSQASTRSTAMLLPPMNDRVQELSATNWFSAGHVQPETLTEPNGSTWKWKDVEIETVNKPYQLADGVEETRGRKGESMRPTSTISNDSGNHPCWDSLRFHTSSTPPTQVYGDQIVSKETLLRNGPNTIVSNLRAFDAVSAPGSEASDVQNYIQRSRLNTESMFKNASCFSNQTSQQHIAQCPIQDSKCQFTGDSNINEKSDTDSLEPFVSKIVTFTNDGESIAKACLKIKAMESPTIMSPTAHIFCPGSEDISKLSHDAVQQKTKPDLTVLLHAFTQKEDCLGAQLDKVEQMTAKLKTEMENLKVEKARIIESLRSETQGEDDDDEEL